MRSKLFLAVAMAACGAVALTGIAVAGEAAKTRVTIHVRRRGLREGQEPEAQQVRG